MSGLPRALTSFLAAARARAHRRRSRALLPHSAATDAPAPNTGDVSTCSEPCESGGSGYGSQGVPRGPSPHGRISV